MGKPDTDLSYPFFEALNEFLLEAKDQIDMARNSDMDRVPGRLKMAIMALKCACEIYRDEVVRMQKEKMDAKI